MQISAYTGMTKSHTGTGKGYGHDEVIRDKTYAGRGPVFFKFTILLSKLLREG